MEGVSWWDQKIRVSPMAHPGIETENSAFPPHETTTHNTAAAAATHILRIIIII
jgi:hypothetical protein